MTMIQNGADNKFMNVRFIQVFDWRGIPVLIGSKSVIEAQKVNQQIAENNYQLGLVNLKINVKISAISKLNDEVSYYSKNRFT